MVTVIPPQSSRTSVKAGDRARLDDRALERVIEYKSTAGVPGASVLWHMLQHVVNHSTYHRGQVTTMLRQLGATPPTAMDLIAFYRERSAATK